MKFEKWQALGNDYLIVERDQLPFELTSARVRKLCGAHFGVFADGVLLLSHPENPGLVADLRIYNPDGSEAELSGNGAREAILYLRRRGWTNLDSFAINTAAGELRPEITGPDTCRVDMGRARLTSKDFPGGPPDGRGKLFSGEPSNRAQPGERPIAEQLTGGQASGEPTSAGPPLQEHAWCFQHVSIGNPQCAIHIADEATLDALDLAVLGPPIEGHPRFPRRTNVSWYTELEPDAPQSLGCTRIRARIFERGVGETLSSGTGATGAAIAYVLQKAHAPAAGGGAAGHRPARAPVGRATEPSGAAPTTVTVVLDGGELQVEVGEDLRVHLTGWARPVFAGRLSENFVQELRDTE